MTPAAASHRSPVPNGSPTSFTTLPARPPSWPALADALAFHGAPRFTDDLDIFVRPENDNAARLLTALEAFGFPIADLSPEAITDRPRMLQMGVPPVQIHVMSAIGGVEWDEAARPRRYFGRRRVSAMA